MRAAFSASTLEIAALLFDDDYDSYRDAILTVFENRPWKVRTRTPFFWQLTTIRK